MEEYRKIQQEKYDRFLEKKKLEDFVTFFTSLGYDVETANKIYSLKYVEKIQVFFRKFRFNDKICFNLQDIINYNETDIIKIRQNNKIYGFHYLDYIRHFDDEGYSNPYDKSPLELYHIRRVNSLLKVKNKFKFKKHSKYYDFSPINFNESEFWNPAEIYGLFESRGINYVEVPENVFNEMLELPPSLYAIEILSDNNANRSYASFDNFPTTNDVQLPLGIYQQLKILPKNISKFKMRIIEPPKGTEIKLRCMITNENLLKDIKGKLTQEINKHKILSLNQIIIVESDINYGMIPFKVEHLEPSNVISIANVDIKVDFLESLPYQDPMESLLIELNK